MMGIKEKELIERLLINSNINQQKRIMPNRSRIHVYSNTDEFKNNSLFAQRTSNFMAYAIRISLAVRTTLHVTKTVKINRKNVADLRIRFN